MITQQPVSYQPVLRWQPRTNELGINSCELFPRPAPDTMIHMDWLSSMEMVYDEVV